MLGAVAVVVRVLSDLIGGIGLTLRRRVSLEAKTLFLLRQPFPKVNALMYRRLRPPLKLRL
jgi:hypothetical protein